MRYLKIFFSFVLAISVSLLTPMDGARLIQAGESASGEPSGQGMDMDRQDHADGTSASRWMDDTCVSVRIGSRKDLDPLSDKIF